MLLLITFFDGIQIDSRNEFIFGRQVYTDIGKVLYYKERRRCLYKQDLSQINYIQTHHVIFGNG
jgi:hypothetical protein